MKSLFDYVKVSHFIHAILQLENIFYHKIIKKSIKLQKHVLILAQLIFSNNQAKLVRDVSGIIRKRKKHIIIKRVKKSHGSIYAQDKQGSSSIIPFDEAGKTTRFLTKLRATRR